MPQKHFYVVIHTEEEFNWSEGFFKNNVKVSHAEQLQEFVKDTIAMGVKVVLAIDYAFANSNSGNKVLRHLSEHYCDHLEFAAHLQPWNSPPFENDQNEVDERFSYPGNLSFELEFNKLKQLTEKIVQVTGFKPVCYLAGRYGVGQNTYKILSDLEYKYDISASPFSDFSEKSGPDYSLTTNKITVNRGITCIPHSAGLVSYFLTVSAFLMERPSLYRYIKKQFLGKVLLKLLGVRWIRLSTEGFTASSLIKLTQHLEKVDASRLIFSFHSPSLKAGLTPYVNSDKAAQSFKRDSLLFIQYLKDKGYESTRFIDFKNGYTL